MEKELEKLLLVGAAVIGVLYVFGKAPKIGASQAKRKPRRPFAKGGVWARGPVTADFADDGMAFPAAPIM